MKTVILGNSGSGKSTLSRSLGVASLDLDTIVWEPGKVAVRRDPENMKQEVLEWVRGREDWVVEGCYGELIELLLPSCDRLIFMNPGLETCLAHNRSRPWEPHKYASAEAQDAMLGPLLEWTAGYYTRTDSWSLAEHRRIFEGFSGAKAERR